MLHQQLQFKGLTLIFSFFLLRIQFVAIIFAFSLLFLASCSGFNQEQATLPEKQIMPNSDKNQTPCLNNTLPTETQKTNYGNGLLSPRIYSGVLEPKSFLITNFEPLKIGLNSFLKENNISASIYVENLRNGVNMGIHEHRSYFPASLNKLPIAIIIMRQVEDGKISLNTSFSILDNEKSSTSGTLYSTNFTMLPVDILMEKMIKESDNTAFNVLKDNVDKKELANLLDYYNIKINVDYPDRRIEYLNRTDSVTAISLYNLFSSLYLSTVLEPQDSEYILSLLTQADFDIKRIANLPDNVTVAQKYGEFYLDDTELFHDCGILYAGESKVFYCIMTKGLESEDAKEAIGYMVNYIYNYVVNARAKLDVYKKQSRKKI